MTPWAVRITLDKKFEGHCADYDGERLTIRCFFACDAYKPLVLEADASGGDALFAVRPYRIELWVNGVLADEEWSIGEPLFSPADFTGEPFVPAAVTEPDPVPPAVIGRIEGTAEGWRPGGGIFVGDCMPYTYEGRYHVLWLKDRRHHRSKWGFGAHQWEHISTGDFASWDIHPTAVEIDDPMEGSICTGSFIACGKKQYLYYTVRMADRSPAPISRSVSTDGVRFAKDRAFRLLLSERFHGPSARDPKVVRLADGFHMFVTTTDLPSGRGALAHLRSPDGEVWTEVGPLYLAPDKRQPECPDFFTFAGWNYLVFSLGGTAHYLKARDFPERWEGDGEAVPCGRVPKAAVYDGRLIFTGFRAIEGYAGTMTFSEAIAESDGTLNFRPFVW